MSARCGACGGEIARRARPDLTCEIDRGVHVQYPASHPVASCSRCGEIWMNGAEFDALEIAVRARMLTSRVVSSR